MCSGQEMGKRKIECSVSVTCVSVCVCVWVLLSFQIYCYFHNESIINSNMNMSMFIPILAALMFVKTEYARIYARFQVFSRNEYEIK